MKAIVFHAYGSPDVLRLEEIDKPEPKENEVLIKIHASSVNDWDWGLLRGVPFVNRIMAGLFKPKKIEILGCDVAGHIEATGKNVSQFKVGDEVFGDLCESGFGGFAEYVSAPEKALIRKPANMTFEQAAALPQAGLLALQGLLDGHTLEQRNLHGKTVLINGASGGAGSFAVQIAKSLGAEVTGVCRTTKMEFVSSLGADFVIDYMQEDFTRNGKCYDIILDMEAHHSIFDYKNSLKPFGRYYMVGGASARIFQILFLSPVISMLGNKKMGILMYRANKDIDSLMTLFETARITPIIDKVFPLKQTADAIRYFGEGYKKGKVIIVME
ncbi:MAG: NAD(P)-dependent alcohol dehydrogenase [Gammaproteobacteria bacterium]|nr:NAD(P)-dependent alcohol dehydrogenase [Gammaproteobacteria bacterium]